MNIKSVCFETLSRHYIKYQEGVIKIGNVKQEFVKRLDPFKAEMQDIIKNSNVVLDEKSEQERELRFKELQEQGMVIDEEFKMTMRKMNDELSKDIYSDLEAIISEWSKKNSIDMIIGSTEVVYLQDKHNITNEILNILKSKDLYIDFESVKGNVLTPN